MQTPAPPSNHREQEILRELRRAGGSCRIGFLARRLGVSDETVRRNIKSLQARELVRKVHGGVILSGDITLTEPSFQTRLDENSTAKRRIGTTLAEMIPDGASLFLDTGSTTAYAAEALKNHRDLYVVTNSLHVATLLATRNNNRVFFAAGELRARDGAAFGADAIDFVKRFTLQYAVLSTAAISAEHGFMLHDIQESDLLREAVKRARTCIVLADSHKFGRRAPIIVAGQSAFDILVTESPPASDIATLLEQNEISLVLADSTPNKA
jgi:DeoR family glycerol-3-phosphate regulon repressor